MRALPVDSVGMACVVLSGILYPGSFSLWIIVYFTVLMVDIKANMTWCVIKRRWFIWDIFLKKM